MFNKFKKSHLSIFPEKYFGHCAGVLSNLKYINNTNGDLRGASADKNYLDITITKHYQSLNYEYIWKWSHFCNSA